MPTERFTYKDLYEVPELEDATAKEHLDSVNAVASDLDAYYRKNSLGAESYGNDALQRQGIYIRERNKAIRIQGQKIFDELPTGEGQDRVLAAMNEDIETDELLPQELDIFNRLNKIPSLSPNISSTFPKAIEINSAGTGQEAGATLGVVFVSDTLDGETEGRVEVEGVTGKMKTINLTANVPASIKDGEAKLQETRELRDAAKLDLERISKRTGVTSFAGAGFGMTSTIGASLSARQQVQSINDEIKRQEKRLDDIRGAGGRDFLVMEKLDQTLKSDEYVQHIGSGWLLKKGSKNPLKSPLLGEVITAVPKGISQMVQGAAVLGTAAFDEAIPPDFLGLNPTGLTAAEVGREFAKGLQEEVDRPLSLFGSSRARFRDRARDRIALGVLEEFPQLFIAMGAGSMAAKVFQKTADSAFDSALKGATRRQLQQIAKNRAKVMNVIDDKLAPFFAAAPDSFQVVAAQASDAMSFMDRQLKGFPSIEAMDTVIAGLRESDEEGAKEQLADLEKRSGDYHKARDSFLTNSIGSMAANQALEFIPFWRMMRRGKVNAGQMLEKWGDDIGIGDQIREVATAGVNGAFENSITEGLQTVSEASFAKGLYDENLSRFGDAPEAMVIAAIVGSVSNIVVATKGQAAITQQLFLLKEDKQRRREVDRLTKDLVTKDEGSGKYIFKDRIDEEEEFDSAEEAAEFSKVRHKARLLGGFQKFQKDKGDSAEDIDTTTKTISIMVNSVAMGKGIDPEGIYEDIKFEDLSKLPEPDLIANELIPIIERATGELRAENPSDQFDLAVPEGVDINLDRGGEIDSRLKEAQFKQTLHGATKVELDELKREEESLQKAKDETDTVNRILADGVSEEEETKLLKRRAVAQGQIFRGATTTESVVEVNREDRIGQIDDLLATNVLSADERAVLEGEKQDIVEELDILEPAEKDEPLGSEITEEKKLKERKIKQKSKVEFDDESSKRRQEAGRRILEKERNKEKALRRKKSTKLAEQVLFRQGERGRIQKLADQNKVLISALRGADASTLIHEMFHALDLLTDEHGVSLLDATIGEGKEADAFWKWATEDGKHERRSVETRERLASGFENYLSNGTAPNDELSDLFGSVSTMLKRIYSGLKQLPNIKITKKASRGFDRLFQDFTPDSINPLTNNVAVGSVSIFSDEEVLFQRFIPPDEIPPGGTPVEGMNTPMVENPDGTVEGTTPTDPRTFVIGTGARANRKIKKLKSKAGARRVFANAWDALTRGPTEATQDSLPQSAWDAKVRQEGLMASIQAQGIEMTRKFTRALDVATGKRSALNKVEKGNRRIIADNLNEYLKEKELGRKNLLLDGLPSVIRPLALEMRTSIDKFTDRLIAAGVAKGKMKMIFEDGKGSYLHRSYQLRKHGAAWVDHVRKDEAEIIEAAKLSFKKIFGADTEEQQELILNRVLNPANFGGGPVGFFASNSLSVKQKNIMKHRNNEIPPEWRALWGEEGDPLKNYTNTIIKQAQLLTSHNMIMEVKQAGIDEGWIVHESDLSADPALDTKIKNVKAKSLDPLAGFMTTSEIAGALNRAFDTTKETAPWLQVLFKGNQIAKLTKTAGSLATHIKNFEGSGIMYVGNGNLDVVNVLKGAGVASVQAFGKGTDASKKLFFEVLELGVADQNLVAAEFHNVFEDAITSSNTTEFSQKFYDRMEGAVKKGTKQALVTYNAGDTVWKTADYLSNLDIMIKAYNGTVDISDLKRMAAARTRATMPTYGLVPKPIRALSKFPAVGVFVSFQAESIRITVNQLKLSIQDMRSDNPVLQSAGRRRLAGLVASRLLFSSLSSASMSWSGISKEEDEALRNLLPEWDRLGELIYFGRDLETGEPIYTNTQYLNPYNQWNAVFRSILNIDPDNIFSGSAREGLLGVGSEMISPFMGEEIGFRQFLNVLGGARKATEGTQFFRDLWDVSSHAALEIAMPSTFPQLGRLKDAFEGEAAVSGPEALGLFGFGMSARKVDFEKAVKFKAIGLKNDLKDITGDFTESLVQGNPVDAVSEANIRREGIFRKGTILSDSAIKWGMSPRGVRESLQDGGMSETDIRAIMTGRVSSVSLTESRAIAVERANPGFLRSINGIVDIRRGKKRISVGRIEREARR